MRIAFLLSSRGGSPMVVGLENGLRQLGHHVYDYRAGKTYDLVLIFNQSSHTQDYEYPEFPRSGSFAFIDTAEYGYFSRLPEVAASFGHAFSPGSLAHDTKNPKEQTRLQDFLRWRSYPYFLREYSKHLNYPVSFHPIDYPLYHQSGCGILPNREQYLSRDLDLFCSWGASHPWRMQITQALRDCHTKCEIFVLEENGTPRMPQRRYFDRTRAAKTSVSFDGYGSSSFRMTEVLVRCLLLVGPLSIACRAPLVDGVHCVEYGISNDGQNFLETDICQKLREALADPEGSYQKYAAGHDHCMAHYTEKATAQYVLDVVNSHDWSKITDISPL